MRKIARHVRVHFVAYLALFFALGGTSVAAVNALPKNSVGSPQIKNGSIQKVDISKRTVSALRGLRGPRGLTGATGATGAAGATGAVGAKGDKGDTGAPGPNNLVLKAQQDTDPSGGTDVAGGGQSLVNTVNITAPTPGVLTISGNVFINNENGVTTNYVLVPKVDGAFIRTTNWGGFYAAPAGNLFELTYAESQHVAAGAHIVTQFAGPYSGTASYFWNGNEMTVQFTPDSNASVTSVASASRSASQGSQTH